MPKIIKYDGDENEPLELDVNDNIFHIANLASTIPAEHKEAWWKNSTDEKDK